jgi:tellurite resistance protein TehA-like permease
LLRRLRDAACQLYPGYFALVMATGIVSLAAHFEGLEWVACPLFLLNNALYLALWLLTLARLALARDLLWRDLTDHANGPAFLTLVAGTCILGTEYVILADGVAVGRGLWLLGLALWPVLFYTFLTSITVRTGKPPLERGLNGAWMLIVVSAQSLAVLGALLGPGWGEYREPALFVALSFHLLGGLFYVVIVTLVFYRFTFLELPPDALTPPYWINMGAVAISTLAGARLLQATGWDMLDDLRPFLKGVTLALWATATWWLPFLLILGDWRHVIRRVPLAYNPAYWAMVFPLGMYAVATFQMQQALGLPFLRPIPVAFTGIGLVAWAVVFAGMAVRVGKGLLKPPAGAPSSPHARP